MGARTDESIPFAGCTTGEERPCALVGLPDDRASTFARGSAAAPEAMRRLYDGRIYNATTESGCDLTRGVMDLGDWPLDDDRAATREGFTKRTRELLQTGIAPFFCGGDHAVTIPIVEALDALDAEITVVQIDAHPDLYPEFDGDAYSHACVGARILDFPHVRRLLQIGIRTLESVQREVARRHEGRVVAIHARDVPYALDDHGLVPRDEPVYLTVDLDGIDPAFAPGVAHPVPGGLSSRQVLDLIQCARWRLVGMDVTELNPSLDERGRTAVLAGRLLHEGMGRVVQDRERG